jgi:biopolymer transport protein ExbB
MRSFPSSLPSLRYVAVSVLALWLLFQFAAPAPAENDDAKAKPAAKQKQPAARDGMDLQQILKDAGWIGIVIIVLSVGMLALIIEHSFSFRRKVLMPPGLAEEVHQLIMQGQVKPAYQLCQQKHSFLGYVVGAGLQETGMGYSAVEKAMEDASTEQSARLFRKIEYLSVIGTLAPMIGLLGTVWGLMEAFQEFEVLENPHISQLAPGIRKAMVTTLMGLMVAVPSLAAFAFFRNRIDELVAESSLMAEHVFADFKRTLARRRTAPPAKPVAKPAQTEAKP